MLTKDQLKAKNNILLNNRFTKKNNFKNIMMKIFKNILRNQEVL